MKKKYTITVGVDDIDEAKAIERCITSFARGYCEGEISIEGPDPLPHIDLPMDNCVPPLLEHGSIDETIRTYARAIGDSDAVDFYIKRTGGGFDYITIKDGDEELILTDPMDAGSPYECSGDPLSWPAAVAMFALDEDGDWVEESDINYRYKGTVAACISYMSRWGCGLE